MDFFLGMIFPTLSQLEYFQTAFHQQQMRDDIRLQAKINDLKLSMEKQVQEGIQSASTNQKKDLENTVQKLQQQINILK